MVVGRFPEVSREFGHSVQAIHIAIICILSRPAHIGKARKERKLIDTLQISHITRRHENVAIAPILTALAIIEPIRLRKTAVHHEPMLWSVIVSRIGDHDGRGRKRNLNAASAEIAGKIGVRIAEVCA